MTLQVDVVTLAPDMWHIMDQGVVGRAKSSQIWNQTLWQLRDFSERDDKRVDDRAYGGGPGMVLSPPPLRRCLEHILKQYPNKPMIIQMDPAGQTLDDQLVNHLATQPNLVVLCGRYEGIDARITQHYVDLSISTGPYVLSGGDLPGMCLIDAVVRQLPGALGNQHSAEQDSYAQGLLDHPHFTRPEVDASGIVPEVLTSGNHADIVRWRRKMALGRTWANQPHLLQGQSLSQDDIKLLQAYIQVSA